MKRIDAGWLAEHLASTLVLVITAISLFTDLLPNLLSLVLLFAGIMLLAYIARRRPRAQTAAGAVWRERLLRIRILMLIFAVVTVFIWDYDAIQDGAGYHLLLALPFSIINTLLLYATWRLKPDYFRNRGWRW